MRFVANRRATDMTGWRQTERTRSTRPRSMPSEEARGAQRNKSTPKCVRLGARGAGNRFLSPALQGGAGRPRKTMACPTTAAFKCTQLAHLFHDKPLFRESFRLGAAAVAHPAGNHLVLRKIVTVDPVHHVEHLPRRVLCGFVFFVEFVRNVAVDALHPQRVSEELHGPHETRSRCGLP